MPSPLRNFGVRILLMLSIGVLIGCSGLDEIAQNSVDQFAVADQPLAPREAIRFQVPEDGLAVGEAQLE